MKTRIIKKDTGHKCPVTIAFGNSRFWGSFYEDKDKHPATFIAMFVKDITPRIFNEFLEHEMIHQCFYEIKKMQGKRSWNKHQEHWAIDKLLQAREDWI